MKPTEINLTLSVVNVLKTFDTELKQLNEKMNNLRIKANDLLIGIALNNNIDLENNKMTLAPDYSKLIFEPVNKQEEETTEDKLKKVKPKATKRALSE